MIKKYQVTLFCPTNEYKPIACIVRYSQTEDTDLSHDKIVRKELQKMGVKKICEKRYWSLKDLQKYNFTKYKIREVE